MRQFPFYTGQPQQVCSETPAALPLLMRDREADARKYIAEVGLVDAVNVMLILGQPLLLTGEPGTGKTQLAYSVGCELGFNVLKFETKSTSTARDLFYTYDTLGRFHAAQVGKLDVDVRDYITYNALGMAILLSQPSERIEGCVPGGFAQAGPRRSVVLIDEIDKAPRDFPNDLLNEIENLYFKVPELGLGDRVIAAGREMRPLIIITSNSEKNLPDAFLRRCVFYNIQFPDVKQLREIVLSHLPSFGGEGGRLFNSAIEFFLRLRGQNWGLDKRPATAELLSWLSYLRARGADAGKTLAEQQTLLGASLSTLLKSADDQQKAQLILSDWLKEP